MTKPLSNLVSSQALAAFAPHIGTAQQASAELREMQDALEASSKVRVIEEFPDVLWVALRPPSELLRRRAVSIADAALAMLTLTGEEEELRSLVKLVLQKWLLPRAERRVCRTVAKDIALSVGSIERHSDEI